MTTKPFPDISLYRGFYQPVRAEVDIADLEVIAGEIPTDIRGTLYRCGPEPQYAPSYQIDQVPFDIPIAYDQYFNGEGMVHRFRIEDGRVEYRSRWVRNDRFLAQEKEGRSLFGRYRNRYTNDPLAVELNPTTSNTHIVYHAGKLMALKEDGMPVEIDPVTLETRPAIDFDGKVTARWLSAHPKIDAATDEMHTFAFQAKGDGTKDMAYYRMDHEGNVVSEVWFEAPYAAAVHDYAIAGDYLVFGFFPLITDIDVVKAGGPFYQWHRDQPSWFAVLPASGTADDIRWFKGPTFFASHIMNAYVDGNRIEIDLDYSDTGFIAFPNHDGAPYPPPSGPDIFKLAHVSIDLSTADDVVLTFPLPAGSNVGAMSRTDDRFQGQPYRHGYTLAFFPSDFSTGVAHIDRETGVVQYYNPGSGSTAMEPVFVPKSHDAPEGEGYLLVTINREKDGFTDLVFLDALHLDQDPIAIARIPLRSRFTFHGSWVDDQDLGDGVSYHRPKIAQ